MDPIASHPHRYTYATATSIINFQLNAQNSDFGHVRTYSSLHKLRNTQGKIHGTYLGNIYGIYKECIRNIHRYLWYKIVRNTGAAFGGAPMERPPSAAAPLGLCFWLFDIMNIYGYSLYIPYIFHIYFLDMFHVFSLVLVSQFMEWRVGPDMTEVRVLCIPLQINWRRWY